MWWNSIGRTHEDIVRAEWQAAANRFGAVQGYPGNRLPAPELPGTPSSPADAPADLREMRGADLPGHSEGSAPVSIERLKCEDAAPRGWGSEPRPGPDTGARPCRLG